MIKLTEQQYTRLGILNDELQNDSLKQLIEDIELSNRKLPKGTVPITIKLVNGSTAIRPGTLLGRYWYLIPCAVDHLGEAVGARVSITHVSGLGVGDYKNRKTALKAWGIFSTCEIHQELLKDIETPPNDIIAAMSVLTDMQVPDGGAYNTFKLLS